jgi:hypothetical protein
MSAASKVECVAHASDQCMQCRRPELSRRLLLHADDCLPAADIETSFCFLNKSTRAAAAEMQPAAFGMPPWHIRPDMLCANCVSLYTISISLQAPFPHVLHSTQLSQGPHALPGSLYILSVGTWRCSWIAVLLCLAA